MTDRSSAWQATLLHYEGLMSSLLAAPGLSGRALGVPEWDAALHRLGREWMASSSLEWPAPDAAASTRSRDVYLATQLYETGGHTALIGDFVRALDGDDGSGGRGTGRRSHLILTGPQDPFPLQPAIARRIAIPADRITLLTGSTLLERVSELFAQLHMLRPERLFLFQHPHDVLASVCAQPEIAPARLLVHHSDGYPTFGLHLPEVQVIDLNPSAVALTRVLGGQSWGLALTAPDPGPGPRDFLRRGALVTASCGIAHKFFRDYAPSYPEIVAQLLRATGGWHVHVGALDEDRRDRIDRALDAAGVGRERFEYIPYTASLATTLWDRGCDIYLASFPISGARARAEVLAAGIPYLRHSTLPLETSVPRPGDISWHRLPDLLECLRSLTSASALAQASATVRAEYERTHHPAVFADTLQRILDRECPETDPDAPERRLAALEAMARTQVTALLPGPKEAAFSAMSSRIDAMSAELTRLQQQNAEQSVELARLRDVELTRLRGEVADHAAVLHHLRLWRHTLRRWLGRV